MSVLRRVHTQRCDKVQWHASHVRAADDKCPHLRHELGDAELKGLCKRDHRNASIEARLEAHYGIDVTYDYQFAAFKHPNPVKYIFSLRILLKFWKIKFQLCLYKQNKIDLHQILAHARLVYPKF